MATLWASLHAYRPRLSGGLAIVGYATGETLRIRVSEHGLAIATVEPRGYRGESFRCGAAAMGRLHRRLVEAIDTLPDLPEPHRFDRERFLANVPDPVRFFGGRDPIALLKQSEPVLALVARLALMSDSPEDVFEALERMIEPHQPLDRPYAPLILA
jgi:hypothetical protein